MTDTVAEPKQKPHWTGTPMRWSLVLVLAVVIFIAVSVASDLLKPANDAGRLSDLRSYYRSEQTNIESCSGGLYDSIVAARLVLSGDNGDRSAAESIAAGGAQSCNPSLNESFYNMITSAPPRSLASYGAVAAGNALYAWAYPRAAVVQTDIENVLSAHDASSSRAVASLQSKLTALAAAGRSVERRFQQIAARLHGHLGPFRPTLSPASKI